MAESVLTVASNQPNRYVVTYCVRLGKGCSAPSVVVGSWDNKATAEEAFRNTCLHPWEAVYFVDKLTLYTKIHQNTATDGER